MRVKFVDGVPHIRAFQAVCGYQFPSTAVVHVAYSTDWKRLGEWIRNVVFCRMPPGEASVKITTEEMPK